MGFGLSAFFTSIAVIFVFSLRSCAGCVVVPSACCPLPKQQGFMGVRNSAEIVLAVVPCNRSEKEHRQHRVYLRIACTTPDVVKSCQLSMMIIIMMILKNATCIVPQSLPPPLPASSSLAASNTIHRRDDCRHHGSHEQPPAQEQLHIMIPIMLTSIFTTVISS